MDHICGKENNIYMFIMPECHFSSITSYFCMCIAKATWRWTECEVTLIMLMIAQVGHQHRQCLCSKMHTQADPESGNEETKHHPVTEKCRKVNEKTKAVLQESIP